MISALLIVLSLIVYVALMRRAYLEAKEDARLARLKGGPMPPRPRRHNDSGARLPWGDL